MPSLRPALTKLSAILLLAFAFALPSHAQITDVTGETRTPTPGDGRDYIHMLNETVDPATGSLSVRISVPTRRGRKLSLPFAFAYDSDNAWFVEPLSALHPGPNYNIGVFQSGGWSYTLPQLSSVGMSYIPPLLPPIPMPPSPPYDGTGCFATGSYIFTDPSGGRHNLGLSHIDNTKTIAGKTEIVPPLVET